MPIQPDIDLPKTPFVRKYIARLSQGGTNDPVVTQTFLNTLGAPVTWTRSNVGIYIGTCTGLFTGADTLVEAFYTANTVNSRGKRLIGLGTGGDTVQLGQFLINDPWTGADVLEGIVVNISAYQSPWYPI